MLGDEPERASGVQHRVVGAAEPALMPRFLDVGLDLDAPAKRLQEEAAGAFERSWHELLENIDAKSAALTLAG